jgi:hypothetical protein
MSSNECAAFYLRATNIDISDECRLFLPRGRHSRLTGIHMSKSARALLPWATRLRSPLSCVFAVGVVVLLGCPVRAESDVLMRMVGLALTGSVSADTKVIGDRANCVFAIKDELYRLNNVYTDRINIRTFQPRAGDQSAWITLTLEGDEIVFEQSIEPPKDDGSETMRKMRVEYPDFFRTRHYTYTQYELHLTTNDQDKVKRAWQYIYSHGCTGKQSRS